MNCTLNQVECTFDDTMKKQTMNRNYIEALEARITELQNRVTELETQLQSYDSSHPSPGSSSDNAGSSSTPKDFVAKALSRDDRRQATPPKDQVESWEKTFPPSEEFDPDSAGFIQSMKNLDIGRDYVRHMGRSSTAYLIWQAIHLRTAEDKNLADRFYFTRRLDYWLPRPWELEISAPARPTFIFPERVLLHNLVNLYFEHVNALFPVIHRPTFMEQLNTMAHAGDTNFACILLVVCAIGARYSDDPRVLADPSASKHSAGWSYYSQVEMVRKPMIIPPKLQDIQIHCLSVLFMYAASMVVGLHVWTRIGVAIRFAQDAGAHRRRTRKKITIEDELWNRCFWILVGFDRIFSATLGRACAIQDEEFSIRYPMEVDDEYWDPPDPDQAWKQPPEKPAVASTFVAWIRLTRIVEMTLRTIYTINRTQLFAGVIEEGWERQVITELDSALNKWQDVLPQHLRWNPEETNIDYLDHQMFLQTFYTHTQILIHKPFITPLENSRPVGLPSLEICTSAARSCAHAIDVHLKRSHRLQPYAMSAISSAGVVLILSLWTKEKATSGHSVDRLKEYKEVNMCMDYMKALETRWVTAGRFWDILSGLSAAHKNLGKRGRDGTDTGGAAPFKLPPQEASTETAPYNFMDLMSPSEQFLHSRVPDTPSSRMAETPDSTSATAGASVPPAPTPTLHEWFNGAAGTELLRDPAYNAMQQGMQVPGELAAGRVPSAGDVNSNSGLAPTGNVHPTDGGISTIDFASSETWIRQLSTSQMEQMLAYPPEEMASNPGMDEAWQMWANTLPPDFEPWSTAVSAQQLPQVEPSPPEFFPYPQEQSYQDAGSSERPSWF